MTPRQTMTRRAVPESSGTRRSIHLFTNAAAWFLLLRVPGLCGTPSVASDEPPSAAATGVIELWRVSLRGETGAPVEGRLVITAQDGGLIVEERSGRLQQLKADAIAGRAQLPGAFVPMNADELSADLLRQVPPGFEVHHTQHYVLVTNSTEEYAEFCGQLLEKVCAEYFEFCLEHELPVAPPSGPLPVIIFHATAEFQEFALRQHPETSFEDTPGYYSIRENQMLLTDLTRDRSLRNSASIRKRLADQPLQVATVVHEAVHQLAFNTGLQVRLGDNPLWLTEGLAMYFEPAMPRSSLLWSRPGVVNVRHHQTFLRTGTEQQPAIPFSQLVGTDTSFLNADSVASAYAGGWALTTWVVKNHRSGLKKYFEKLAARKPLQPVSPAERVAEFREAFGKSPDEMHRDVISYVKRIKVPRQ
jgi:Protein of unknown function (DUF1570)